MASELPDHLAAERLTSGHILRPNAGFGARCPSCAEPESTPTGRSRIPTPTRRRCRRSRTSGWTSESSRPSSRRGRRGCARTPIQRLHDDANVPVEHVVISPEEVGAEPAVTAEWALTPKPITLLHRPRRTELAGRCADLGMLLFIASEIMLFGSFFTAYFFIRVQQELGVAAGSFHLPVFVAGVEHGNPGHLELHDPLGAPVNQAQQPCGSPGRSRPPPSRWAPHS